MQGKLTVKTDWQDINSLPFADINGATLTLGAASGDTIKFYKATHILFWQGAQPSTESIEGTIALNGDIIIGAGAETIYVKALNQERVVTVELVKGA